MNQGRMDDEWMIFGFVMSFAFFNWLVKTNAGGESCPQDPFSVQNPCFLLCGSDFASD